MKYRFSSKAKFDINSIWIYTFENWSHEQADRYYNQLVDGIQFLSDNPEIGRDFTHDGKTYKFKQVNSHLIFYRAISASQIEIIRILHKRMDIENRLRD